MARAHFLKKALATTVLTALTSLCYAQIDTARVKEIIGQHAAANQFSGTVLVADKGKVVVHSSFGPKELGGTAPIDNHTSFSVASITKMVTAILILQLAEEGKIKLNSNLAALLPEYKIPNAEQITVHHLLLHISGLPSETDADYLGHRSPKQMVRLSAKRQQEPSTFGKLITPISTMFCWV